MYDKIKVLFNNPTYRYIIIGGIGLIICLCIGYIFYQPSGTDYQRTINAVERAQEKQRESLELNRSIQYSIDRSTELSHEAATRIDRSKEYNRQINNYIDDSQGSISKARDYLKRNAELFDRVERESRERQSNNQETQDATQPISDGRSGGNHWSGNTSMNER
jgi:hypothetical protein